jgi:stearoyl-CoA desaturase (delta-9 desaturase)
LCCGHSVGFHRRLIHRSFKCPKWLERILIYLGTVVGMGGPFWTVRTHDMRDWAQRSPNCHPFFAHKKGFWQDAWWYLHCRIALDHPPRLDPGPSSATTGSISGSTAPRCGSNCRSPWCCSCSADCRE